MKTSKWQEIGGMYATSYNGILTDKQAIKFFAEHPRCVKIECNDGYFKRGDFTKEIEEKA